MTPNEKELLNKFKQVGKASVVTMSRQLPVSINYAQVLCKRLVAQGFLEVVTPGRWPVYKVRESQ